MKQYDKEMISILAITLLIMIISFTAGVSLGPSIIRYINSNTEWFIPSADDPYGENPYAGSTKQGTHGRFYINDLGIDVALYDTTFSLEGNQDIVDAEDSAVYLKFFNSKRCIVDHASDSRFGAISEAVPFVTCAEIVFEDSVEKYVCIKVDRGGKNNKTGIFNGNGVDVRDLKEDRLITYTCNDFTGENITIVFWKRIGANF